MIKNSVKRKQPLKINWFHKRFFNRLTLFLHSILKKRRLKTHQGITQLQHVDNMALDHLELYLQHTIIKKHLSFRPINRLKINKTHLLNQKILQKQIQYIRGKQKPKIIEVEKDIYIAQTPKPKLQDRFITLNKNLTLTNTILKDKFQTLNTTQIQKVEVSPNIIVEKLPIQKSITFKDRFITLNKHLTLTNTILKDKLQTLSATQIQKAEVSKDVIVEKLPIQKVVQITKEAQKHKSETKITLKDRFITLNKNLTLTNTILKDKFQTLNTTQIQKVLQNQKSITHKDRFITINKHLTLT
ncbi:MAG: hypothetical protein JXQ76_02720, partial [Campylobacterales bacterium]|nr:hypothetical protein [Campylobacterales bacterium]